ncbi:hypothetical protein F511_45630 [Dorcoceras hygrometricum]|uniref:Uncharacterized protein n=1 Tax=Dorcoceras hygrometricum TaxID=472368 RepID=A0A2Z6ZVJ7_9LAMI|nr:hypothetical protein F511_45630 [Dorcoceras hygrometricum]
MAVRKLLRKWPVDVGGWVRVLVAPPRAYVAQIRRLPRRWLRALLRRWCCATTCDDGRDVARAGRTLAVRTPHEKRPNEALLVERDAPHDGTRLHRALSRPCVIFRCWPPPAGRRSEDVVTAGLNSSRVWFGPVPGSP